ncbi:MAG TPA: hypothetical protein VN655_03030 [Pseudolabrys sp.]|nr:hypothetical protein [Pseudolabrys sp.]
MMLRRALLVAVAALPLAAGAAFAQFPGQQPQQQPPCIGEFTKLRLDTENKAKLIQEASKRHATPKEACRLFTSFHAAQTKMLKYATDNATWCGIPPQVIEQIKSGTTHSAEIRTKLCKMAEAPPRPTGPSLSDALTAPVPNADNIRTGHGTFDTLTGAPIGK